VTQYDALCKSASAAHRAGNFAEALTIFTQAGELEPGLSLAWNGAAAVLADMGRGGDAVRLLESALDQTGFSISVAANFAILLERQGRNEESAAVSERILALDPSHADARLTLGLARLRLGQTGEAVRIFQDLASDCSGNSLVYLNLGEALMAEDAYELAIAAYKQALTINPQLVQAWIGQGQALAMLQRFHDANATFSACLQVLPIEAAECFRTMASRLTRRLRPNWLPRAEEIFLSRLWSLQQVCDWRFRNDYARVLGEYADRLAASGEAAHDPSLVFQSGQVQLTRQRRRSLLDAVARGVIGAAGGTVRQRKLRPAGPLRLGFISSEFRDTPVAQLHWRQFALHDRSRFTVHAYSLLEDKASPMRRKIVESVDHFHDLSQASATEAAWKVARDGIDILVDLTGHVEYGRPEILALRPAPIRVSLIGGLTPIGKQFVDYKFTDPITTPDESEFTEALVFLPDAYFIYNDQESISGQVPTRSECGLPEDGFVFCGFNSGFKIEPGVFSAWMGLLRDISGSVLWLRSDSQGMVDNLRREAEALGVESGRLVFAHRMERSAHLARHACADLFLDTWICNAATTTADALWAGLPVLTLAGDTMGSRVAASLVTAAGLPELVVSSPEEYRSFAHRLATQPETVRKLRQRLIERRNNGQLFDMRRKVKQLERGFEMMWEHHVRGASLTSFMVPDDTTVS
jgi:predicted O-linked N-acetylglucosamine transferase (SPINDLY family)